ncbi:delta(12)-fatty-acid desaturase FAD2-like [Bidens hawaiensis]|uniref:delta(12)-fatty-acid desaturase FAD2-like n=1 Tax=Bidens hawaiensis TaxID=980011 RepID=UPI00404A1EFA
MGAGGRWNPSDPEVVFERAPTSKPEFTLGDIKKAIPPHCFERPLIKSFSYLGADVAAVALFYYVATTFIPQLPHPLQYIAWPLYWVAQGTVMMGLWVIGHECGHHAFSDYEWLDDTVGFFVHTFVTTPYFSWKFSHRRHHSNTGSLERDEVYVPKEKSKLSPASFYFDNPLGRTFTLTIKLTLGWYIYLSINAAGRPYDRFASHFDPRSPIFLDNERLLVLVSDIGLLSLVYLVFKASMAYGLAWVFCVYLGALTVTNMLIVIVTYLQHTHPSLPHYDDSAWNWMNGALVTVDRDFGQVLNRVLNRVTDTHVVHHLFSYLPHYHAVEATKAIKPILGEFYQFDSTPFYKALWRESKVCLFIEPDESDGERRGVFWYSNKY